MTLRELTREFLSAEERQRDEFARSTVIAYQTIRCWVMTKSKKRMPSFASLLPAAKRTKAQSAREVAAMVDLIAARYGGKVGKLPQ